MITVGYRHSGCLRPARSSAWHALRCDENRINFRLGKRSWETGGVVPVSSGVVGAHLGKGYRHAMLAGIGIFSTEWVVEKGLIENRSGR